MIPEVAYFRYMREYNLRFEKAEGPAQVARQLRPDIYAPNYEFFVPELVCWEHARPRVKWGTEYNRFTATETENLIAFTCADDGLLDPVSFKKCPACGGAFYDLFRHQYQVTAFHHCWNCLEDGSSKVKHPFYKQYTNHAPPDDLIPPVVTPEAVQKGEDDFWERVNRLLSD